MIAKHTVKNESIARIEARLEAAHPRKKLKTKGNARNLMTGVDDEATNHEDKFYDLEWISDVERKAVEWLWPTRFALGKLNLIAGQPGVGKSQIALNMAATVSVGGEWPDGTRAPKGSVIIISCEDDVADTIEPRLVAANADVKLIARLKWVFKNGRDGKLEKGSFCIEDSVENLRQMITDINAGDKEDVKLIIIDPISAYMGRVDSYKNAEVRGALEPMQELAAEFGVCFTLITHLNKGGADKEAMSRVSGSTAFISVCRSSWLAAKDSNDEEGRRSALTVFKNNIGDDKTGFYYSIDPVALSDGIKTSRIVYVPGGVHISADQLLQDAYEGEEGRSLVAEAAYFLEEHLSGGRKYAKATQKEAIDAGISLRTLRRARRKINVKIRKCPNTRMSIWSLPEAANPQSQDTCPSPLPLKVGQVGLVGQVEGGEGGQGGQLVQDSSAGKLDKYAQKGVQVENLTYLDSKTLAKVLSNGHAVLGQQGWQATCPVCSVEHALLIREISSGLLAECKACEKSMDLAIAFQKRGYTLRRPE